jgi:hypothetical protein
VEPERLLLFSDTSGRAASCAFLDGGATEDISRRSATQNGLAFGRCRRV